MSVIRTIKFGANLALSDTVSVSWLYCNNIDCDDASDHFETTSPTKISGEHKQPNNERKKIEGTILLFTTF